MRVAAALSFLVLLGGCSELHDSLFGPSAHEVAANCGVTEAQLQKAKDEVKQLQPYEGRDLGRCSIIKDDSGTLAVVTISKPPKGNH